MRIQSTVRARWHPRRDCVLAVLGGGRHTAREGQSVRGRLNAGAAAGRRPGRGRRGAAVVLVPWQWEDGKKVAMANGRTAKRWQWRMGGREGGGNGEAPAEQVVQVVVTGHAALQDSSLLLDRK